MSTFEGSVSRSQCGVLASEQSIRQSQQNLLTLEIYTQRMQEDGSTYVGHAEATVKSLTGEASQLKAEQARLASINEQSRLAREATIEREVQQQQQTVTGLRTELGNFRAAAGATDDQIRIVAERDKFQADLQHARATEAGKHATTSFLEARLTETQAALQKGRIEADALETKLRGKERQS